LQSFLVLGVLLWAARIDLLQGRIPNALTLPCLLMALLLPVGHVWGWWPVGWFSALQGVLLASVMLLPLYVLRWLGAGDAKLGMAIGGLLGYPSAGVLIFLWFVCTGVLALLLLWLNRMGLFLRYQAPVGLQGRAGLVIPHAVSLLVASLVLLILL
jgi:prepilin peptidase CpaA